MSSDITFQGGHIYNNHDYPEVINTQSKSMLKQMGKNVNLTYATVNEQSATSDLASIGFSLRYKSATESMQSVNASVVDDKVSSLVRDFFEEDIEVVRGTYVFMALMENAIDNRVSSYSSSVFASSMHSQGSYYSYQLTFYSMRKASYCFLVLSFIAFKNESSVFGIPTSFRTGVSYKAQIFECKKILNNVIYNFGILRSGESMGSPDGKHKATLNADGNFVVGPTNSANKGTAPRYLTLQSDANLVIYDANNQSIWAAGCQPTKFSQAPYRLELQNDGNLVIYDANNTAMWSIGPA
ncbi:hypothetical protein BDV93DRAFT_539134 [Ceratobasidium sp. AG-I]|nr:hypothetical protein BDV93DRAFT_539134 [Ceratobasidium sp. AG-I]